MLTAAIIVFILLFIIVQSYRECSQGAGDSANNGWGESGYKYIGSVDSDYNDTHPKFGRLTSVFKTKSPESWPFKNWNRAGAITVYGARKIAGIPHVR